MTKKIIALDPGVVSGFCVVLFTDMDASVDCMGEMPQFEMCRWLEGQLKGGDVDTVVCESFTITQRTLKVGRQPASLEIIGTARYLCEKYGALFVLQTPADAKRFATDKRIKAANLWKATSGGHANDAGRHMLLRLAKLGKVKVTELDREG